MNIIAWWTTVGDDLVLHIRVLTPKQVRLFNRWIHRMKYIGKEAIIIKYFGNSR